MDSAKIHEQDAEHVNQNLNIDQAEQLPLYTEQDVITTMGQFKIVDYGEVFDHNEEVSLFSPTQDMWLEAPPYT
ncbi:hypothetical protein [Pedobacter xixiisoli]|uniref:hypothetical protein n=1 Tax=Pedobacter xixiisoli TaxID=1476464 RepID=UPI001F0DFE6B|nr:hypothetical protein [Pedobacter xixiisoli]